MGSKAQIKETLGERLKRLRTENNLIQQQVADALNIDRSTYSYYEKGKTEPNHTTTMNLAKIFNVSVQELITGEKVEIVAEPDNKADVIMDTDNKTKEEGDLLAKFRVLSKENRDKLMKMAEGMTKEENPKTYNYKNKK